MYHHQKTKKTSTVSFRINKEYDEALRAEAEEKKVSMNTLVNQIFGEYVDWNKYVKRFGTIILSREAFKLLLESLDDDKIRTLAVDIATKAPREFILFKWKEIDQSHVIGFIKMFFDHCGYGQYSARLRAPAHERAGQAAHQLCARRAAARESAGGYAGGDGMERAAGQSEFTYLF